MQVKEKKKQRNSSAFCRCIVMYGRHWNFAFLFHSTLLFHSLLKFSLFGAFRIQIDYVRLICTVEIDDVWLFHHSCLLSWCLLFFYHYYHCSSFLISWAPSATGAPIPGMHERSLFLILNHLRTVTTRVISLSLSLCAMPRRPHNIYKRTYTIVVYQKNQK